MNSGRRCIALSALAFLLSSPAFAVHPAYTLRDLGIPAGWTSSFAGDINDFGVVAGTLGAYSPHAAVWRLGSGWQDIGTLGGRSQSYGRGINNLGQVVGESYNSGESPRGYIWDSAYGMREIPGLGTRGCQPYAINDSGCVVGSSWTLSGTKHAFAWDSATGLRDLGVLPGADYSEAFAISNTGYVAGWAQDAAVKMHAVIWDLQGAIHDLGALPTDTRSSGYGVNDLGEVVGSSGTNGDTPVLWDTDHAIQSMGLPYGSNSIARGVNNAHKCVGSVATGAAGYGAFLWDSASGRLNLPNLGGIMNEARAINELGQVAGNCTNTTGSEWHAVTWTPVPEPSSLIVVAVGIGTLLSLRRRRA